MYSEKRIQKFLRSENFILAVDFRVYSQSCTYGFSVLYKEILEEVIIN